MASEILHISSTEPGPSSGPPTIDALDVSQKQWRQVFTEGPFTSFGMVNALMQELRVTYEELLGSPQILHTRLTALMDGKSLVSSIEDSQWVNTWSKKTGRCTSFAVKIAKTLEREYPDTFDFQYFDLGRHRIARCASTGILIHSHSDKGAKIMDPTEHWSESDNRGPFKYHTDGYSIHKGSGSGEKCRRDPVSPEHAISVCLQEVAQYMVLVCLFRYVPQSPFS